MLTKIKLFFKRCNYYLMLLLTTFFSNSVTVSASSKDSKTVNNFNALNNIWSLASIIISIFLVLTILFSTFALMQGFTQLSSENIETVKDGKSKIVVALGLIVFVSLFNIITGLILSFVQI